jgi:hypothetical protein
VVWDRLYAAAKKQALRSSLHRSCLPRPMAGAPGLALPGQLGRSPGTEWFCGQRDSRWQRHSTSQYRDSRVDFEWHMGIDRRRGGEQRVSGSAIRATNQQETTLPVPLFQISAFNRSRSDAPLPADPNLRSRPSNRILDGPQPDRQSVQSAI